MSATTITAQPETVNDGRTYACIRNDAIFGVAQAVASPPPSGPFPEVWPFGGRGGEIPRTCLRRGEKNIKKVFFIAAASPPQRKTIFFLGPRKRPGTPCGGAMGKKPRLREGVPPKNVPASAAKQAVRER